MKTPNQKKRDFFRVLIIVWLIVLAACLVMKLCGLEVSDYIFITDSILMLLCCISYKNFDQAAKEDEKFGSNAK